MKHSQEHFDFAQPYFSWSCSNHNTICTKMLLLLHDTSINYSCFSAGFWCCLGATMVKAFRWTTTATVFGDHTATCILVLDCIVSTIWSSTLQGRQNIHVLITDVTSNSNYLRCLKLAVVSKIWTICIRARRWSAGDKVPLMLYPCG